MRRSHARLAAALACAAQIVAGAGCNPRTLWCFTVPEQRHLDIRDPAQLPPAFVPPLPTPETVTERLPKDAESEQITLDEAIRIALTNSRVVRVLTGVAAASSGRTVYDPAITNTFIDEQKGVLDPALTTANTLARTETPFAAQAALAPLAAITGTSSDNATASLGLSKRLVTGGTAALDVTGDTARTEPRGPLDPQTRGSTRLSLTQPLLRGAGVDVNLAPIVIARIDTARSFFQYKDAVQELVRGTVEAYWSLVFAHVDVWTRTQQVEQGDAALLRAEARKRQGFGNSAEVAQARVSLANFKASLITSEANLLTREAAFRNLLGLPPTSPKKLIPVTPPRQDRVEPKWAELLQLAADRRPDLIELKLVIEADQQQLVVARNNALPQVDLSTQYRWNGLEGETPTGARLDTAPGQFADWSASVNFSVPLGLRAGRAGLRRAELVLARDRANLQQGIHAAVHDLAGNSRNLAQFHAQFRAFRDTRLAARDNLEQQLADFRAGRSIFLNVLEAISSWGNAVSSEAQSLASYNTELANLERQSGTILEAHGITFFEERFAAVGPLGPWAPPRDYPKAVLPDQPEPRYPPAGKEPPEAALDRDKPAILGRPKDGASEPLTPPRKEK